MNQPNSKRSFLSSLFHSSVILSLLLRFAHFLYDKAGESFIGFLLSGQKLTKDDARRLCPFLCFLSDTVRFRDRVAVPLKRFFLKQIGESFLLQKTKAYLRSLPAIRIRAVGYYFLSFGLVSLSSYLVRRYALADEKTDLTLLLLGVSVTVVSLPLLFSGKSISHSLTESPFCRFLLFSVMGIRPDALCTDENRRGSSPVAVVFGIGLGLIGAFSSPLPAFLLPFGLIGVIAVLSQPEIGVFLLFLALPFLSTMMVAALLILTMVSTFCKVIQGKRFLTLLPSDIAVFFFALLLILGGVISVSPGASIKPALLYTCLLLGYFLVCNLIRTPEWLVRCLSGLLLSGTFVSLLGIFEYYFGTQLVTWTDQAMFGDIGSRVISTFGNPNVLGEFLILLFPIAFVYLLCLRGASSRFVAFLMCGAIGLCLIFTWSRGAWLGLLFGMVLFFLIYSRKTLAALLLGCLGVPFLPLVLPDSIVKRFTSIGNLRDTSTAYRVNIWKGAMNLVSDVLPHGIGIGQGAFSDVYVSYSLAGIEAAPHAHNLYLQILIEIGLTGLLVFLLILFLHARETLSFCRDVETLPLSYRLLNAAGFCGIVSMLVQGMTDYVWYNYRIFCLFWLILGLMSALRRVARSEFTVTPPTGPYVELPIGELLPHKAKQPNSKK